MIQLTCFVKAKPGMSREDFHRYWSETHGPLVASLPEVRKHTLEYTIHHRLDADYHRPNSPPHDGVAVHTFHSLEAFQRFMQEPVVAEVLGSDNAEFLDSEQTMYILTGLPERFITPDRSAT